MRARDFERALGLGFTALFFYLKIPFFKIFLIRNIAIDGDLHANVCLFLAFRLVFGADSELGCVFLDANHVRGVGILAKSCPTAGNASALESL
jgi:hypothetical protein